MSRNGNQATEIGNWDKQIEEMKQIKNQIGFTSLPLIARESFDQFLTKDFTCSSFILRSFDIKQNSSLIKIKKKTLCFNTLKSQGCYFLKCLWHVFVS